MEPRMILSLDNDGNTILNSNGDAQFKPELENIFVKKYYVNDVESTQAEYESAKNLDPTTVKFESMQVFHTEYYVDNELVTKEIYDSAPNPTLNSVSTNDITVTVSPKITKQIESKQPILQPQYKVRWVKADGTIISKNEYDTLVAKGELVYCAAFVGCTYHCG